MNLTTLCPGKSPNCDTVVQNFLHFYFTEVNHAALNAPGPAYLNFRGNKTPSLLALYLIVSPLSHPKFAPQPPHLWSMSWILNSVSDRREIMWKIDLILYFNFNDKKDQWQKRQKKITGFMKYGIYRCRNTFLKKSTAELFPELCISVNF